MYNASRAEVFWFMTLQQLRVKDLADLFVLCAALRVADNMTNTIESPTGET